MLLVGPLTPALPLSPCIRRTRTAFELCLHGTFASRSSRTAGCPANAEGGAERRTWGVAKQWRALLASSRPATMSYPIYRFAPPQSSRSPTPSDDDSEHFRPRRHCTSPRRSAASNSTTSVVAAGTHRRRNPTSRTTRTARRQSRISTGRARLASRTRRRSRPSESSSPRSASRGARSWSSSRLRAFSSRRRSRTARAVAGILRRWRTSDRRDGNLLQRLRSFAARAVSHFGGTFDGLDGIKYEQDGERGVRLVYGVLKYVHHSGSRTAG
jgi:hypothetical protein